jgi:SulP family sulfate permease
MKKLSDVAEERTKVTDIRSVKDEMSWPDEHIPEQLQDNVIIKHLDGPLFFGFASGFLDMINKLPDIKYVVIRMEKVPFIDQSGLYALEEAVLALEQRGIEVVFTGLQKQPAYMLRRIKLIPELISENNLFTNFMDTMNWLATHQKIEKV